MIYKYKIKNLKLFGYHGVFDKEKKKGQYFYININYSATYNELKDDIATVVDYSVICQDVENVFNNKRYDLLEVLALDIKLHLSKKYTFLDFKIKISKNDDFMDYDLDKITIEN